MYITYTVRKITHANLWIDRRNKTNWIFFVLKQQKEMKKTETKAPQVQQ